MKKSLFAFAAFIIVSLILAAIAATYALSLQKVSGNAEAEAEQSLANHIENHPHLPAPRYLAIVDYTLPSFMKRMVVIDKQSGSKKWYRVAHAKKSGTLFAQTFSNVQGSNLSSLGLFKAGNAYSGDHGTALRLHGLDPARNGNAFERDIVLHAADYVSVPIIIENLLTFNGLRLGRSQGCFVVSPSHIKEVVDLLSRGGYLYAYGQESGSTRKKDQGASNEY